MPSIVVWVMKGRQSLSPSLPRQQRPSPLLHPCLEADPCHRRAAQAQLRARLESEAPRSHVDARHRLDKDGKKYGKLIKYELSELRMIELLDDLCEGLPNYELAAVNETAGTPESWLQRAGGKARHGGGSAPARPARILLLPCTAGGGASHEPLRVPPAARSTDIKRKAQQKQLANFCADLIERHEDKLARALREGETQPEGRALPADRALMGWGRAPARAAPARPERRHMHAGLEELLCLRISSHCAGAGSSGGGGRAERSNEL